jgi:hypothetical protein
VDCITEDDWPVKFPFEDGQERQRVDARSLTHQAGSDGQAEQSMSHGPPERVGLGGRMIEMKRIKVTGEPREQDNVRFRDRPARAFPLFADHEVIE